MSDQEFNEGHIPEAIDRCHIIMTMIDELLSEHPAIVKSKLDSEIENASSHIMNAYQKLSEYYVEEGEI